MKDDYPEDRPHSKLIRPDSYFMMNHKFSKSIFTRRCKECGKTKEFHYN